MGRREDSRGIRKSQGSIRIRMYVPLETSGNAANDCGQSSLKRASGNGLTVEA